MDENRRRANERLIRRYWDECRNGENFDLIEEIFASDHVGHGFGGSEGWTGIEGVRSFIEMDHVAFADARYEIRDLIVTDGRTVTRWIFHGIHNGPLMIYDTVIETTGNVVAIPGVAIDRIENGKIAETWVTVDTFEALCQLDVLDVAELP